MIGSAVIVILGGTAEEGAVLSQVYVELLGLNGGVGHLIDGLTGLIVVVVQLGVLDGGVALEVAVGTVVLHGRIQHLLHGVDVGVRVDGRAVSPLGVGVQGDLVDQLLGGEIALRIGGEPLLTIGVGGGDVLEIGSAFEDPLEVDAVLSDGDVHHGHLDEAHQSALIAHLPGVGVPVDGARRHGQMIGELGRRFGLGLGRGLSLRLGGLRLGLCLGFGLGLGLRLRLGSFRGGGFRLRASDGHTEDHEQSQQDCNCLLHHFSSCFILYRIA